MLVYLQVKFHVCIEDLVATPIVYKCTAPIHDCEISNVRLVALNTKNIDRISHRKILKPLENG